MSRDWQKDMEMCSSLEGEEWMNEGTQLEEYDRWRGTGVRYIATFDREEEAMIVADIREALPYWLQQYAAEKERADRMERRAERYKNLFLNLNDDLNTVEAREQKLREAMEWAMKYIDGESYTTAYSLLESTLYPKEEEAK